MTKELLQQSLESQTNNIIDTITRQSKKIITYNGKSIYYSLDNKQQTASLIITIELLQNNYYKVNTSVCFNNWTNTILVCVSDDKNYIKNNIKNAIKNALKQFEI